jgi:hypothetical protein
MEQIHYRAGYKYQLTKGYTITLQGIHYFGEYDNGFLRLVGSHLTIRAGYAWDGPSGPTFDTPNAMRGSLVHDALYQLIGEGVLTFGHRDAADCELARICREDGMHSIRAGIWYQAVKAFGKRHSQGERPELVAPR